MTSFDIIKKLCEKEGISISALERELGYGNASLSKSRKIPAERIYRIAQHFQCSMEYLMTGKETPNDFRQKTFLPETDLKADFCIKAKDDSMKNARIFHGDMVFIREQKIVKNGEIAAVSIKNHSEILLRRFYNYQEKSLLILRAEHALYEDLIFQNEEIKDVHVFGKAIAFQSVIN